MNKPKFLVTIAFNEQTQCMGSELSKILKLIKSSTKDLTWYGADIQITGNDAYRLGLENLIPKRIGSSDDLINISNEVSQFLCGVFLATLKDLGDKLQGEFATEDESYRDISNAVIEIRAFDTSYFEVYTNEESLTKALAEKFSATIELNKTQYIKDFTTN